MARGTSRAPSSPSSSGRVPGAAQRPGRRRAPVRRRPRGRSPCRSPPRPPYEAQRQAQLGRRVRSSPSTSGCPPRCPGRTPAATGRAGARVRAGGSTGSSGPSRSIGTQRYWLAVQPPRGRSRTIFPSAASSEQDAACRPDLGLPPGADPQPEPLREEWMVAGQLARRGLPPRCEGVERRGRRGVDPGSRVVGQAALRDELLELTSLVRGNRARRRGVDDRDELARHDEDRSAHRKHPHERPFLVERAFELSRIEPLRACSRREEDRRRVARVQDDDGAHRVDDVARLHGRRQPVPSREPRPALLRVNAAHGAVLSRGRL